MLEKFYIKIISKNPTNFTLTIRSVSETFARRSLYQMVQGSGTHSKGGTAFYEPGRGQLHTEPHILPISCHVASLP